MSWLDTIFQWDTDLLIYLNNLGSAAYDDTWKTITNKKTWFPLYLAIIVLVFYKKGWKAGLLATLMGFAMVGVIDFTTSQVFKEIFKRPRPCSVPELEGVIRHVMGGGCGGYSFFSGHSSNSFGIAIFFGTILRPYFKGIFGLLIIWAAVVAFSRVYVGVHYPIDIIMGMIWGVLLAKGMLKIYYLIARKYNIDV